MENRAKRGNFHYLGVKISFWKKKGGGGKISYLREIYTPERARKGKFIKVPTFKSFFYLGWERFWWLYRRSHERRLLIFDWMMIFFFGGGVSIWTNIWFYLPYILQIRKVKRQKYLKKSVRISGVYISFILLSLPGGRGIKNIKYSLAGEK